MGMGSVTLSQPLIHSLFALYCEAINAPHQWCEAWTRYVWGTNTSLIDGIKRLYTGDIHCIVLIKKKLGQHYLYWPNFFFIDCKTLSYNLVDRDNFLLHQVRNRSNDGCDAGCTWTDAEGFGKAHLTLYLCWNNDLAAWAHLSIVAYLR